MIKIPFNEIIAKIKERSGLSEQEILSRMDEKVKQLSGLISREGAAHIVANELGIKLFDAVSGRVQIKNILAGMRDVETVGRVQKVFPITEFSRESGSGKVASFMLADETGIIRVVLWNEQAELALKINANDIVKIKSGYVRERNGQLEVHINQRSKVIVNPPDETVPEISMAMESQARQHSQRKKISELKEGDSCELFGTIVQVFDIRFYESCPECKRRLKGGTDGFFCETHGPIKEPRYGFVMSIFLDDGTGSIRVVCFKEQAMQILGKNEEQMLKFRDFPEKFDGEKTSLLGEQVVISGRVSKNPGFDRIEFIASQLNPRPSPDDEIAILKSEEEK